MNSTTRLSKSTKTLISILLIILFVFTSIEMNAQNSFNSGDGWGAGWGTGSSFSSSAGSSLIYTTTNSLGGNVNRYFRLYGNGTPCGEYGPSGAVDVLLSAETAYTSSTITCGSTKAFYVVVPNTTDNWVFKTNGVSSQQLVIFRVQGAVRTVSAVSQTPSSNVRPGQSVTVSATMSGAQSTGQNYYLRYSTDNFTTSTVVAMTVSSTTATGTIPALAEGVAVKYYVFTSGTTTPTHSDADFRTINLNNNGGSNYSYTVAAPAQYTWNQTGTAAYGTATNWTPNRTTALVSDVLIFNNGATTTITGVPTESIGSLQVSANTTVNLQPATTNTLTINNYVTGSDLTVAQGSKLTLATGLTLTIPTGAAGTINGTLTNAGVVTTNTNLTFSSTGVYEHNYLTGVGIIPTATWSTGSTCSIIGYTSGGMTVTSTSGFGQTFSNFTYNCPNQTSATQMSGYLTTINGTFNIINTGTGINNLRLSQSSLNYTANYGSMIVSDTMVLAGSGTTGSAGTTVGVVNISGDLTLNNSGLIEFNSLANAASVTLNLSGNLSMSGTTGIRRTQTATSTFNFVKSSGTQTISIASGCNITGSITYNIGNGTTTTNTVQLLSNFAFSANTSNVNVLSGSTLDLQAFVISGASTSFTTNSGSTLKIGHVNGITASAASGAIQVGTRTYNTGANYVYSGTADQATGDGLPATVNTLTIANTGSTNNTVTVTNTGTLAISSATAGALTLTSGALNLQASTDTISIANTGGITATSGDFSSSSIGGVKFLGTGTVTGTVNFYPAVVQAPSTVAGLTYSSGSTIRNTLTMKVNSFIVASNAPNYAANSTLIYNIGTSYGRSTEWSATSGRGYPYNVTVKGNTTLDIVNSVNSYKKIAGTLTVESGSTLNMQTLTTGNGSGVGLEVLGNVVNDGTISLSSGVSGTSTTQRLKCVDFTNGNSNSTATTTLSAAVGGDLEVTGNLTDHANFTANNRAVFFTGTGTQTIGGTAPGTFNVDYIVSNKASGSVKILKALLTEGPNGGNAITLTNATDIFDLNGFVLTVGKASVNSTVSGSGKFKGGSGSGMIVNGTGSLGTLNFDVTTPGTTNLLSTFTANRTSTGTLTLGSDLNVGTTLTLTSGVISTGSNNLIVNSGATVSRTSGHVNGNLQKTVSDGANSFEIGSASVYAPATATMSGVSGVVVLTAKATSGNPTSGSSINQLKKSNHYWNITKTGAGTFTGYDATFDFTNTTNTGSTDAYKVNKYDGSWANVTSSVSGTTITATGLTSFSDFEVGELLTPSVTTGTASSITTTSVTLNGTVNANGYSSTVTFNYGTTSSYGSSATADQSPVTGTTNTSVTASISSLSVNTQYNFTVSATNTYGTSSGSNVAFYTLANTPGTPTVNNTANATMDVTLDANGNPSNTQFAIQETSTGNYVQADGSLGATAIWQTASVWGTETVTGLSGGTTYTFQVKARNGDNTETSFSSTASGTTTSSLPPIVVAPTATNITSSSADLGGNVSSDGGAAITARGIVWSYTSQNNDPFLGESNVIDVTTSGTTGAFSINVTGLTSLSSISYKAFATNSQGTTYSSVATFNTTASEPTTQASSILFSSITTSTMSVSWTNGDGGNRAVFMKAGSGAIANPINATSYSASSNWASLGTQLGSSGYYCIYNGTGNSVSLTGLSAGTQYYVQVFEYNADGSNTTSSISYLTSTATGNPGNAATLSLEPASHAASFSATTATSSSINLSFSAASSINNAAGYLIIQTTGSAAPTGTPADATAYTVGSTIGDGTVAAIISNTASTSQTISGLSAETQYSFVLIPFGYNGSVAATYNYYVDGTIPSATATTFATTPSAQPTAFSATSITCNAMNVSWTAASGSPSGYIVLRSSGATAPNTDPVIGTSYAQGSTLGNATVVYVGSAVSFANSSLSDNTTYSFKIYSYNGSGSSIAYNTTSPLTGSQLTSSVSAPTAITATNITNNSFTANWNEVSCATGYSLYVGSSVPDTVAAWTWPTSGISTFTDSTVSLGTPNYGISNFSLSSGTQTDNNGFSTRAAGATTWNSIGKFYQVIVNATGYANLTVSSAQQSSASGPRDFQLEYKIGSGGTWTAVSGGAIVSGNGSFTSLSNVALPSACNNQSQVYLRWVTTSLLRADQTTPGSLTAAGGTNRIDDIYIKGNLVSTVSGFNPATVTGSSATVTGLAPLATISYYLTATAPNSTSAASNTVTVTTTADPATADFRTKASGNFSSASIWQYKYDGVNWGDAPQAPSSGNNITVMSTDSVYLTSDISMNTGKVFTVNGKIDINTKIISGTGSFVLTAGSSIYIGNAAGLTGALTIANTTRDAAANYIFNGTIAQTAGFLPATLTGNVIIDNPYGVTLISNKTLNTPGTLTVKANAALAFGTGTTTSAYNFNGTGNFEAQAGSTLTITNSNGIVNDGTNGSLRLTGTRTFASGVNYVFAKNDAANQSRTGASFGTEITSVNNLTFNNPLGSRLNSNITVNGTLSLVSGRLNTDAYKISVASGGSLTKSDTSWVVGTLEKNVATGSPSVAYEVGPDSLTYTPVSLDFNTVSSAGAVAVSTTKAAHPNLSSSVLSSSKRLNYYINVNGAAVFTNYAATLTYTASNVLGSASTSALIAGIYNSGWNYPSMGARTSTSAAVNSIAGYGDIALSELNCTIAATPSSNSPVCNGNTITLSGSYTGGYGTVSYSWSGPNSYSSTSQIPSITNASAGDAGIYTITATDSAGCQSSQSVTVVVNQPSASTTNATVCSNQLPYSWNSNSYSAAGTYSVTLTNAANCDSVATLVLTVNNTSASTTNATVCSNQLPYSWNSNSYSAAGTYSVTLTNAANCDSVATLVLTVNNTSASTTNATVCSNQLPYSWNSNSYSAAGTYSVTLTNAANCDSVATLVLTVNNTSVSTTNATVCSNQLPYSWNSNSYSAAGTYSVTLTNAANCDSVATLVLTVNNTSASTTNATVCSNQLPYSWNSNSYSAAGTYSVTLTNAANCDSVATLVLTVDLAPASDTTAAACGSFAWYGNTYSASGDYDRILTAANGCDSIITLHLTINAIPSLGAISGPAEVCSLVGSVTPTVYSVTAVAGASAYNWTVPTGVVIQGGQGTSSLSVTFTTALAQTNQRIYVTAVSAAGCSSSTVNILLSKTIPNIPASIAGPTNICSFVGQATNAVYTCDSVGGATAYQWTVPTGASIVSGQGTRTISVSYTNLFTSGAVTVTAQSNCGNRSPRSLTVARTVPGIPVAISGPVSACSYIGTATQVSYTIAPVANAASYLWTVPTGVTIVSGQGTTTLVVTFNQGYISSSIKVRSVANCGNSADKTLAVAGANFSAPGPISGPTNACPFVDNNDVVAIYTIRKVANAPAYIWTLPAGATIVSHPGGTGANDTIIQVSFSNSFVYGSSITVQTTGCGTSAPRSITIGGVVPSTPGLIAGPANVCEFMVSASNPNGNIATYTIRRVAGVSSYAWAAPANATIIGHPAGTGMNDTAVQIKYNSDFVSGTVSVISVNGCGNSTARALNVTRLNPATPGIFDVVLISACPSRVYSYTMASMPSNATSVLWTVPVGATIVNGQGTASLTVSYPPSTVGGQVTAQALNNCSSSAIRTLNIKLPACPSSFAGNNQIPGKTALQQQDEDHVAIAPNPSAGPFTIQLNGFVKAGEQVKIRVMDQKGAVVKQLQQTGGGNLQLGADFKSGVYFVEIIKDSARITRRVVRY